MKLEEFASHAKPTDAIQKLIDITSVPENIKTGRNLQIISFSQYTEPTAFILHEGYLGLHRNSDHMLVAYIKAPILFNINFLTSGNPDMFVLARGTVRYEEIKRDDFIHAIEINNQWKNLAFLGMHINARLFNYAFKTSSLPTYELICNNLIDLMNEPEKIRSTTNICVYIQEKTMISRSHIMKILSDLKKGGYIKIEKGVLTGINHLPESY